LLYFKVGEGSIHHGQTIIRDIETDKKLSIHIKDEKTGEVFDATNIFPEYFYISVPLFDEKLEKDIDDWLYVMKHDDVPKNFHSPYMKIVAEKLSMLKMTKEERDNYFHYQKKLHSDRDELKAAEARGIEKGIEKTAINFIKDGLPLEVISRCTNIPVSRLV
jgi:hypothetical protein